MVTVALTASPDPEGLVARKRGFVGVCWFPVSKWVFPKIGVLYPQIIYLYRVFHCKPSILGMNTLHRINISHLTKRRTIKKLKSAEGKRIVVSSLDEYSIITVDGFKNPKQPPELHKTPYINDGSLLPTSTG